VDRTSRRAHFSLSHPRVWGLDNTHVLINRYEELGEELPRWILSAPSLGEFGPFSSGPRRTCRGLRAICGSAAATSRKFVADRWEWQEPIAMPPVVQRLSSRGQEKSLFCRRNDIITKGFSQFTSGVFRYLPIFSRDVPRETSRLSKEFQTPLFHVELSTPCASRCILRVTSPTFRKIPCSSGRKQPHGLVLGARLNIFANPAKFGPDCSTWKHHFQQNSRSSVSCPRETSFASRPTLC